LLTPADRMEGGFRLYSEADVARILLIKQLQQLLGFSLAEIKDMVEAETERAHLRALVRPDVDEDPPKCGAASTSRWPPSSVSSKWSSPNWNN